MMMVIIIIIKIIIIIIMIIITIIIIIIIIVKDGQHGLTKSHITEHAQRLRHKIDWQNYLILATASNDYYLKIKETLLIKERIPIINNDATSVILNLF